MSERYQELAVNIVSSFRASLDAEAQRHISETQLSELTLLIRNALTNELEQAAASIEATAQQIRSGIEKRQMEL